MPRTERLLGPSAAALLPAPMLVSRVTVPITVVLTTLDETPEQASARVTRFLTRRLRALADVSGPEGLWTEYGDEVSVVWGHLGVEVFDDEVTTAAG